MMTEPHFTTLARDASVGSDRIFTVSRTDEMHYIVIEPGTLREEALIVRDCRGFWPHLVLFSWDMNHLIRLRHSHVAGSVVRIEPVSAELAAARQKAAMTWCWHSKACAVRSLEDEVVAWLCPDCDEQLPAEWATAQAGPALP